MNNKKVLLRERKEHTDRGISSTTRGGVPPPHHGTPLGQIRQGGTQDGVPPVRVPPARSDGVPQVGYPCQGTHPSQVQWGGHGVPDVGSPPLGSPSTPGQVQWGGDNKGGSPQLGLMGGTRGGVPPLGYLPGRGDLAGMPHPQVWTDRRMDGQTRVKT